MGHPDSQDAQQIAEAYDEDEVIVFYVDRDSDTFGYASYGATSSLCDHAIALGNRLYDAARSFLAARPPE